MCFLTLTNSRNSGILISPLAFLCSLEFRRTSFILHLKENPWNTNTENMLSISDGFNGSRQARIALDNVFSEINPKMSAVKW